nr:magnesium transporter [Gammaproteobacteria bacterium]
MIHNERSEAQREASLEKLKKALADDDFAALVEQLRAMHPAEIGRVLESLAPKERLAIWQAVEPTVKGEVLLETYEEVRDQLIQSTRVGDLVIAVSQLQLDELVDLSEKLPKPVLKAVIRAMDGQRRQRFQAMSVYPEDTAGGLMDADALSVRADVTLYVVQRYLRHYRRRRGSLPEHTDVLMVVDRDNRYLGLLPLTDILTLKPSVIVGQVMDRRIEAIPAHTSERRVARFFEDRDLVSAPVIDDQGYLIGRITVDDVIDVIREEGEHSVMRRAGLDEHVDLFAPVFPSAMRRAVWLGVNLFNAFIAASVIGLFDAAIEQLVALAVLMPVVASMGGVAGVQSLTLVTRAIALGQLDRGNARRLLFKELSVSLVNGLLWAVVVALVSGLWFNDFHLALIFAIALIINLLNGAMVGTLIPLLLNRLGIDPALAGGVMLVAATDVIGFFAFLGLASFFLL